MNRVKDYGTLALYPIAFFAVFGMIQYLILKGAYRQQALGQHPVPEARPVQTVTTPMTDRAVSQFETKRPDHILLP